MAKGKNDAATFRTVEERPEFRVDDRVTGTVRIQTRTQEREEPVEAEVTVESIDITRVPMDRMVEGPIADRSDGDVTIISVVEEMLVTQTRFRLVEEVRIERRRELRRVHDTVKLRRQDVDIERS